MPYTVKELASSLGISVRTLHWYHAIGLLKPAYYGKNGYRYYEEAERSLLKQILFFRELGMSLQAIRLLLLQEAAEKICVLEQHRKKLIEDIAHQKELIQRIDKTIRFLQKDGGTHCLAI
jgi:DNA-binding transcriptional MerR regulator